MQQVTSFQEIETFINQNGEMVIGKNSKNNVIIMSMEEYRNNVLNNATIKKLLKSEEDIENGRTRSYKGVKSKVWILKMNYLKLNLLINV